ADTFMWDSFGWQQGDGGTHASLRRKFRYCYFLSRWLFGVFQSRKIPNALIDASNTIRVQVEQGTFLITPIQYQDSLGLEPECHQMLPDADGMLHQFGSLRLAGAGKDDRPTFHGRFQPECVIPQPSFLILPRQKAVLINHGIGLENAILFDL